MAMSAIVVSLGASLSSLRAWVSLRFNSALLIVWAAAKVGLRPGRVRKAVAATSRKHPRLLAAEGGCGPLLELIKAERRKVPPLRLQARRAVRAAMEANKNLTRMTLRKSFEGEMPGDVVDYLCMKDEWNYEDVREAWEAAKGCRALLKGFDGGD